MTNFEKLKAMDSDSFTEAMLNILNTPFRANIDWKAYMKGESEIPTDYFFSKERVKVLPSEAELISVFGRTPKTSDESLERQEYIESHAQIMTVLHRSRIFDNEMVTVADVKNNRILKVPAKFTREIKE